ncbi:MAG: Maf family nucleotide pyrophosphatase [Bacteroidota bacterium]
MRLSSRLILASGSPRRKQLLQDAGFDFEVKTVPFEEVFPEDMESERVAEFLAIGKNDAYRKTLGNELVLTADTIVVFNDQILGKPKNEQEAINTLKLLSGEIHEVITGVCISLLETQHSFSCKTQVKFKSLLDEEIEFYIQNYRPMDKAGSYAIQEWIGLIGIEWINGSYYNVVGLPVHEVYQLLKNKFS